MENFLGEIRLFAGTFAPAGWFFCDGRLLQIANYDALFSLLGTTYGGDGQATFGLPDLRGRVPIHAGTLPGEGISYVAGQNGGKEQVTLTATQITAHSHPIVVSTVAGVSADPTGNLLATPLATCQIFRETTATLPLGAEIGMAGGSQPHENRQPYMAMNYIIANAGVYPSPS